MRLPRRPAPSSAVASPARLLATCLLASCLLAACTNTSNGAVATSAPASGSTGSGSTGSGSTSTAIQPPPAADARTYVSVGDSYAAGYQPSGRGGGASTRDGFADQVVTLAKARGYDLTLVNFGCTGATTTSALSTPGCRERNRAVGGPVYDKPQIAAAVDYLRAHRGKVALVTVALGGNDITPCADSTSTADATSCVSSALSTITANLTTVVSRLRAAAGPATRIVGITYPDVFLGLALSTDPARREFATLSAFAFRTLINPQLLSAYAKGGATLADVTEATGAYTPLIRTTALAPYGTIPVAVADVCRLTYFCDLRDIHPRSSGHKIIAGLAVASLPRRRATPPASACR